MNIRKIWIDTTRHRLPQAIQRVRERFAAIKDIGVEVASDTNASLSAMSAWAATNPVETLQRGRDPEKGIEYLRSMEDKDAHYSAMLESRKMGLLSHDWNIVPAAEDKTGEEKAEWITWNFDNIDGTFTEKVRNMLDAIPIGFSVQEKVFEKVSEGKWAGKWRLRNIKDKDQKVFSFKSDQFGNLLPDGVHIKRGYSSDLKLPPEKFLIYVFNKKRGSWYGNGVGVVCSWYSWFKKDGLKFWLLLLQKFGNPTAVMKLTGEAKTSDITRMKEVIESLSERTGITLPAGFEIELLEATRGGEAGYLSLLDYCDKQISKKLVGATLTSEPGAVGSYSLGQVHAEIRDEFIRFDALSVQDAINEQVIKPLVDFNFTGTTDYPRFEFTFEQPIDRKALAETLKLAQEAGIVIPTDWAHEELRIPTPLEGEESLVPAPKPAGGLPFTERENKGQLQENPLDKRDFGVAETVILETRGTEIPGTEFVQARVKDANEPQEMGGLPVLKLSRPLNTREQLFADIPGVSMQLERVLEAGMVDGRKAYTGIRDDILDQVKKKLTVRGQVRHSLRENPIVVNVSRLKAAMINQSMQSWLWGMLHGTRELERMGFHFKQSRLDRFSEIFEEFQEGDAVPPPMEAVRYFKNKIPITKAQYAAKTAAEKDRYFTMAGLAKGDIEKTVQPLLLQAIQRGDTFEDVKKSVSEAMIKYTGDIYGGAVKAGEPIAEYHLQTAFRTNLMGSYNAGRMDIFHDPDLGTFVQALQNSSVLDDRTTDQCWKLDQTTYKIDDPIWQIIAPPGHYNCRRFTVAVPYYEEGVKFSPPPTEDMMPAKGFELGYVPTPGTPAAKVIESAIPSPHAWKKAFLKAQVEANIKKSKPTIPSIKITPVKVKPIKTIPQVGNLSGKQWIKSLSADEIDDLRYWRGSGYQNVRAYQKGLAQDFLTPQETESIRMITENITTALWKAKPYEGDVYRGLHGLSANTYTKISNAKTLKWDALSSATTDEKIALQFVSTGTRNVLFKIQNKTGINISAVVEKSEKEVLLQQGAKYKVIHIEEKSFLDYGVLCKYLKMTLQEI